MAPEGITKRTARLTGLVWLAYFLSALPLAFRARLIVPGNAAETADRIESAATLYRATLLSDLVSYALYMVLAYLLYLLLRSVSRQWAAIGALATLAGCFVLIAATMTLTIPLALLDAQASSALSLAERQELTLLALKLYGEAYAAALFFFGIQWIVMGPLFVVSRLVPRAMGLLLTAAGLSWIVFSAAALVAPPLAASMRAAVMPLGALAELTLALRLAFKDVRGPL